MSYGLILRIQGFLLIFLGISMCAPALVAVAYGDFDVQAFLLSIIITLLTGLLLIFIYPASEKQISHREGFIIVSLGWILAAFFGSLPFVFSETFPTFTDAYFETVSGFTTTGATIIADIEAMPHAILFWRSMIQWLGGMGIILFSIAILPLLGIGGMQLYKAEVPGPVVEKIKPRIAETARSLWKVYILLSLAEMLLLMLAGMNLFDAVCHTFTTMATGGFSTKNKSIESFNNSYIEIIIIVFMFAAGMNFALHYRVFHGKLKSFIHDKEFLFYACFLCGATLLCTISLQFGSVEGDIATRLRLAAFQATSIMTTTGYSTANFNVWPYFAQYILLLLMFVGGCAGSTGGGIKCIRILVILKRCYRELFYIIHPHAVASVKISGKTIPENILRGLTGFVILYVLIFIIGSLAMSMCGLDFMTAVSAVAASLGNIGPGFAGVGPYENFLFIPATGKWMLILLMLLGRLEIFTLLILFVPEFWRR
ncbi:TrkH family potassium uptake protein [Thermodesulfobacteriota bacterium]